MGYKAYVIVDLDGYYWTGNGWNRSYAYAKKFYSVGAASACMRLLKRSSRDCYYEPA